LLTRTPLTVKGGPLADRKRKLAGAIYLNWPGMVDLLTPWVEMGVKTILEQLQAAGGDGGGAEGVLQQVRTVAEVLKVLRSYASATYFEDGAWVTHNEIIIRDL
jgi:hypothetical protein